MKKRLLAFLLSFAMVLTFTSAGLMAFAEDVADLIADEGPVAKVGNTEYATIDEAIANWTNGTTLTLLADVTLSDVIQLSSTEHHILDLGTYTMTAASKKDAIQIVNNGRTSASYALDIKADATNPGGITATGKAVVKTTGQSGVKDRPIIRFYNGVFTGTNVVYHTGSNGTNCPQFWFYGGEFNGTICTNRSLNLFYGGTFNGSLMMSVDSSAYALISGGRFKYLSNLYNSTLTTDKFVIGTSKGANDGSVCIDENGYYVISTTTPTTAEASVASNYGSNNYFYYSTVNTDGMYYEDVYMAIEKNPTGTITVYTEVIDLKDVEDFTGTLVVPEGETLVILNAPEGLKVEGEGEYVEVDLEEDGVVLPDGVSVSDFGDNTVTDGTNFYATLVAALKAVNGVEGAVLYCQPGADVGTMTHGHVCADLTVYGNGAYVSGGEQDFEVDTYLCTGQGGSSITDELNLTVIDLNGCGAWGQRNSAHTVNLKFIGCEDMNRVYISGTSGANNITLTNCSFSGTVNKLCTLYSNANGTITVDTVTFKDIYAPINLNHKVAGTQNVVVMNSTFNNCGTADYDYAAPIRVLSSVEGAKSEVTVESCTFNGTIANKNGQDADILLDYGVGETFVTVSGTEAKVTVEKTNNVGTDATVAADTSASFTNVVYVAEVNGEKFTDLQEAIKAAAPSGTVELLDNVVLTETITVPAGMQITLDLNGCTVTGIDNATGSFGLIVNKAELTIKDSVGNGKITLTANNDRDWNAYSSVISNQPGGKLTVEGGTIEHLGGTDMAYGIDNLTNGKGTYAETIIEGGTVKSTYRAIRMFLNGVEAQNILTVNGGTIEGTNKAIWMQDPSAKANTGTLTVGENAVVNGDIYLYVTPGSTEWPVEVAIAASAVNGEVLSANVPLGYIVKNINGVYGVNVDETVYTIYDIDELKAFRDAVNAGNTFAGVTVYLMADIDLAGEEWTPIGNSTTNFKGVFDGQEHTISNLVINGGSSSNIGFFGVTSNGEIRNLTIENANVSGRLNVAVVAGTPYTSKYTNIKVTGHVEVNGMAYVGGVGGKNAYADWTDIVVDVDNTSYVKANSVENGIAYRTYVGGVVGFNGEGGHTFKNISSNIKVIGSTCDIGGIFGIAHYGNNFENITFTGSVEAPEGADEVGGIAGVWYNQKGQTVTFTNVTSTGTVTVGDKTTTGSIVGGAYNADNETAENSGSLIIDGEEAWICVAKIGENRYGTLAEAIAAAQAGDEVVILVAGNYAVPTGKNITVTGAVDGVTFGTIGAVGMGGASVTFNNVTFNYAAGSTYKGLQHAGNLVYNNCTFNGQVFLYGESETFNNCTFNQTSADAYNVWTYGAKKVEFNDCTFNSAGKSVLIYAEGANIFNDVTVNGCTFTASSPVDGKAAIEMDSSLTAGINLTINNSTATGFGTGNVSGNSLWNNKKGNNTDANNDITVTVDDVTVLAPVTFVAKIGNIGYTSLADAFAAAQDGDTVVLVADVEVTAPITVKKSIVLDGNGYKITQSAGCNNAVALLYFEGSADAVLDVTVQNVTFDGIKVGAPIRTLYANITIDNCVIQNCEHTVGQGLVRLTYGTAVITNSKFLNNDCSMAISFNWDGAGLATDTLTVDNCVFEGNTANKTALIYYVKGAGCTITDSEFIGNNVNCNANGAVIYLGFQDNCVVTGNLFKNNVVTEATSSTRVAGAIFAGYQATITGNAFENNTASNANGDVLGQVCISTYYEEGYVDLGDNYWGGSAPVYGKDYTIQHQTGAGDYGMDNYYTDYTIDANGNLVLDGEATLTFAAKIGTKKYATIADAIAAAQAGDIVTILAGNYTGNLNVNKGITVVGETDDEGNNLVNIAGKLNVTADGATVKNINVNNGSSTAGYIGAKDVLIEGCTVVGGNGFRSCYTSGTVTFKDSTITGSTYGIHFDGSAGGEIVIDNCVITGWTSFAATIEKVTMTDTTFAEGNYNFVRFYQNEVVIDGCTFNENMKVDLAVNGATATVTDTTLVNGNIEDLFYDSDIVNSTITVDGVELVRVAKIGDTYYETFAEAFAAAQNGDTIVLLDNIATNETFTIPEGTAIVLDLNGYTVNGTDNATKSFALIEVQPGAVLTINDTVGTGVIALTATNNRGWNAYSSVISNQRGKLIVNGGTIVHYGGTDMAYAIDSLTNTGAENVETIINGGNVKSTYRAIRMFLNSTKADNILTVNGGIVEGANRAIWVQNANANANPGTLTVEPNAEIYGDILVSGSGASVIDITVKAAAAALKTGSIAPSKIPTGYIVDTVDGYYVLVRGLVGAGTETDPYLIQNVEDLIFFRDSVNAGETKYNASGVYVALAADIDLSGIDWSVNIGDDCNATFDGIFDGQNYTISNLTSTETAQKGDGYICTGLFGAIYGEAVIKNLTIKNATINTGNFTGANVGVLVGFAYTATGSIENVKVIGDIKIDAKNAYAAGSIVGYVYYGDLEIKNCVVDANEGSYIVANSEVGGIVGYGANAKINGCTVNNIDLTASGLVGGVAGLLFSDGEITDCTVTNVNVTATGANWINSAAIAVGTIASDGVIVSNVTCSGINTDRLVGSVYAEKPTTVVPAVQARIGDKYYGTLAAAIAAADAGDTVVLVADVALDVTVTIDKAITLDLNGCTVTGADDEIVFEIKAATTIVNGAIKGNKSGTSSGLIEIYADLTMDGVTVETSKYNALRFKAGSCTATLTDCTVIGAFKGYGGSVWNIVSGTYKASSTSISDQLNGTASVSGGIFYYAIDEVDCAPGYAVVDNGDGTWTVKYAPVAFVDADNDGVLDDGEAIYGSLETIFETYQSGDVYIVLLDDTVIKNKVDTDADAKYFLNAAEGVTVEFAYAEDWNYVQNMYVGENVTLKVPYLVVWNDFDVYGTVIADYLYIMGGDVLVAEGAEVTVTTGDATVQVKGGATLTVNGTLDTAILNVWSGASELIVSGRDAEVTASWIDIWDGTPSVVVENGATLEVDAIKASRGGSITVQGASLYADSVELGHNGESEGHLTVNNGIVSGEIKLTAIGSTFAGSEGLNVTTNIDGYEVVYEDGIYKVAEIPTPALPAIKFTAASLTLQDNISINFKVDPSQFAGYELDEIYVVYTINGEQYIVSEYTIDASTGRYSFAFKKIAPRMMNDEVLATLCVVYNGETIECDSRTYSVKQYCDNQLAKTTNAKFRTLLVDLLNYGAAAQIYTGYNTENLVNADLTDEQKSWATAEAPTLGTVQNLTYETIENPTVDWKAGGLFLQDAVIVRMKIATDSLDGLTVKFTTDANPEGWTIGADELVETTGGYYVYFDGLTARQMRDTIYITVYRNGEAVSNTMSYSIESYAYNKQNDSNANLVALLEAMMKYGDSAANYLN